MYGNQQPNTQFSRSLKKTSTISLCLLLITNSFKPQQKQNSNSPLFSNSMIYQLIPFNKGH